MCRWWWVSFVLVLAAPVAAQPLPTVTPFPLELKRAPANFSSQDIAALSTDFERLVRKAGADVPDSAQYELALKDLKRQDCDRDDECLKQLAQLGRTLYALYVSLDNTLGNDVVATGRVVRSDGVAMGRTKTVSLPRGRQARFGEVARAAVTRLLSELGVGDLPAQRTVQPEVAVVEPVKPVPPVVATPPPTVEQPARPPPHAGLRRFALIPGLVAGASAIAAGVTYGLAFDLHQKLTGSSWTVASDPAGAAQRGQTLQLVAAITTGVAAAALATFIIFFVDGPDDGGALVSATTAGSRVLGEFRW